MAHLISSKDLHLIETLTPEQKQQVQSAQQGNTAVLDALLAFINRKSLALVLACLLLSVIHFTLATLVYSLFLMVKVHFAWEVWLYRREQLMPLKAKLYFDRFALTFIGAEMAFLVLLKTGYSALLGL